MSLSERRAEERPDSQIDRESIIGFEAKLCGGDSYIRVVQSARRRRLSDRLAVGRVIWSDRQQRLLVGSPFGGRLVG